MDWLFNNLLWIIPAAIVLCAMLLGISDVLRLSPSRIWAISGVCFQESIRRRVLWIIPLAILGVLGASAFQKSMDQQDAIRQIIQFSLFATGMLLVLTLVILACTNLPREIENRVIFTIVTKPTSRLEIILGKVVGFSRVSALVLVIMGAFTLGYLGVQSLRMHSAIAERLKSGDIPVGERASLEYYQDFGLLTARKLAGPETVNVMADVADADGTRWIGDATEGHVAVPFPMDEVARKALEPLTSSAMNDPQQPVLMARLFLYERTSGRPGTVVAAATSGPATAPSTTRGSGAGISVQINGLGGELLADPGRLGGTTGIPGGGAPVDIALPRQVVELMLSQPQIEVQAGVVTSGKEIGARGLAAQLVLVSADHKTTFATLSGLRDPVEEKRQFARFRGRQNRSGQQVRGAENHAGPVALLQYRNAGFPDGTAQASMEIHTAVEHDAGDTEDLNALAQVELTFTNLSRPNAAPVVVSCYPENSRTVHVSVPGEAVAGGNFDVAVRCTTKNNWIAAELGTFTLVTGAQPFAWNLVKSLFVMWLMSLLVIIVSVFTSTFVSWPIAVVLTLLILLGRWGVVQLGDSLSPGIGNQMVSTIGLKDPSTSAMVSRSVEALSTVLRYLAIVLPDITAFSASDDIQRGLQLQPMVVGTSLLTLAVFGLPMLALSYVFLRYKEVAP